MVSNFRQNWCGFDLVGRKGNRCPKVGGLFIKGESEHMSTSLPACGPSSFGPSSHLFAVSVVPPTPSGVDSYPETCLKI